MLANYGLKLTAPLKEGLSARSLAGTLDLSQVTPPLDILYMAIIYR